LIQILFTQSQLALVEQARLEIKELQVQILCLVATQHRLLVAVMAVALQ
jgi:hypothetical protein